MCVCVCVGGEISHLLWANGNWRQVCLRLPPLCGLLMSHAANPAGTYSPCVQGIVCTWNLSELVQCPFKMCLFRTGRLLGLSNTPTKCEVNQLNGCQDNQRTDKWRLLPFIVKYQNNEIKGHSLFVCVQAWGHSRPAVWRQSWAEVRSVLPIQSTVMTQRGVPSDEVQSCQLTVRKQATCDAADFRP